MAREVGLKAGMPVTVGGADGAMHHGRRRHEAGLMSLSVGTSGAVRMAVDAPKRRLSLPHGATTSQREVFGQGSHQRSS